MPWEGVWGTMESTSSTPASKLEHFLLETCVRMVGLTVLNSAVCRLSVKLFGPIQLTYPPTRAPQIGAKAIVVWGRGPCGPHRANTEHEYPKVPLFCQSDLLRGTRCATNQIANE